MVSLGVHSLLCLCLVLGFDRAGIPDGSKSGKGLGSTTILAQFGEDQSPGRSAVTVTTAPSETVEDPVPIQPGNPDSGEAEEMPADPANTVAEPETEVASADAQPVQPEPEDLDTGPRRPSKKTSAIASLLASTTAGPGLPAGDNPGDGAAEGDGAGEAGDGGQFGDPNGTSFFQVRAQGKYFCYVIDCSSSMEEGDTIGAARAELQASLRRLNSSKQFQIIFYDSELHPLTAQGENILVATESNRRLARQFINSQQPTGRAFHRGALLAALQTKPDVIFFLTDGEVPELTARDLYDLKAANRRRTQINVIEFGRGAKLEKNWLDRLASDHRGSYRYQNIADSQDE